MTEQEKRDKLMKYSTRLTFWTGQNLVQFGYSINLFTTISIGVVGFLVSKRNNYPNVEFNCDGKIEFGLIMYFVSLLFAFLATLLGGFAVLSRLYDFRLTRHKLFVRKQTLEKLDSLLTDGFIDISSTNLWQNFRQVIFSKIQFVIEPDYKDLSEVKRKFQVIRKQSKLLGDFSYLAHKIQILLLLFSILLFSIQMIK